MLKGMASILIKLEEQTARYILKQNSRHCDIEWDCDVEIQNSLHSAEDRTIHDVVGNEESSTKCTLTEENKKKESDPDHCFTNEVS